MNIQTIIKLVKEKIKNFKFTFQNSILIYATITTLIILILSINLILLKKEVMVLSNSKRYGNVDYEKLNKLVEESTEFRFENIQLIVLKDSNDLRKTINNYIGQIKANEKKFEYFTEAIKILNTKILDTNKRINDLYTKRYIK